MTNCTTNLLIRPISLTETEFSTIKKQIAKCEWGVLLESADRDHIDSRWSIYSAQPIATLQTHNGKTSVQQNSHYSVQDDDPFEILETLRTTLFHDLKAGNDLPFTGGVLGYIAYELGYQFEQIGHSKKPHGLDLPEMAFGFYDWALLYDNQTARFYLLVHKTKNNEENIQVYWQTRFDWLTKQSKANS